MGQVPTGGVDQDRVLGEIPVGVARAADIAGQALFVALVERELEAGKVQQAGLAGTLGPHQQIPGKLAPATVAVSAVQTGAAQGAQRFTETPVQRQVLLDDPFLALLAGLEVFILLVGFLADIGPPADKHHCQPPGQKHQADRQQSAAGGGPEAVIVDGQQGPDKPDQQCQRQYQTEAPDPVAAEKASEAVNKVLHFSSSLTWLWYRVERRRPTAPRWAEPVQKAPLHGCAPH